MAVDNKINMGKDARENTLPNNDRHWYINE